MHTLICAAGSQKRWEASGGEGLKQLIEIGGETLIERAYRLASKRSYEVTTLVRDASLPCWAPVNPAEPVHEPWMGEMGKFLDGRPYWPESGGVVILYGDVYYTEQVLDLIYGHRPFQPTVYGRAKGQRRLESFAFRFDVSEADLVERVARECADAGMNTKGGPWRWFYRRHTGLDTYSATKLKKLATPENGWFELPSDPTDDFDKGHHLPAWRQRWERRL